MHGMMFGNGLGHIPSEAPKKLSLYSPRGVRTLLRLKKKWNHKKPAVVWVKFGYHAM